MKIRLVAIALFLATVLGAPVLAQQQRPSADTVLEHGFVDTVDPFNRVQQAIAIRDGRIVYVGTDSGVGAYIGKQTEVIDLHGKMVMPGLIDPHIHPIAGGSEQLECSLDYEVLDIKEVQERIQACLDKTKAKEPNAYLIVVNWYQEGTHSREPQGTVITKAILDVLKTKRPIIVHTSFGHSTLANSRAMALAGITRNMPNPHGGRIDRDASGEPIGLFEDAAEGLISKPVPTVRTEGEIVDAAKAALGVFRENGVTAFMAQMAEKPDIQAWSTLRNQGLLTARAYMAPDSVVGGIPKPNAVQDILELKREFDTGPMGPNPNIWVRNSGEIFQDGVQQWPEQTASLLKPYLVNKGTASKPNWVPGTSRGPDPYTPLDELEKLLLALARAGIEPEVHAIGDRAVRHTLDAYAYVRAHLDGKDVRLEIAHSEMVDPSDYIRFKTLNVIPDMSFVWAKPGPDSIDTEKDYIGLDRWNRVEPEGNLNDVGVPIAWGSDWPVDKYDSFYALKVLVTRQGDLGGKYTGRLGAVSLVPVKDAIRAITINGANALHSEKDIGSIEDGKLADLIVISQNLFEVPPLQIDKTKVLLTMVGGKVVYRASAGSGEPAGAN